MMIRECGSAGVGSDGPNTATSTAMRIAVMMPIATREQAWHGAGIRTAGLKFAAIRDSSLAAAGRIRQHGVSRLTQLRLGGDRARSLPALGCR